MIKRIVTVLLATGLLLGLAGCSATQEPSTLKIGTMPTQNAAIYAVGVEKGIFKKHELDVELTIFSSAVERDSAATAGQLDGFLTDVIGVINLNENNYPFKITSSEYENFAVMAGKDTNILSLADLSGKKVGIANNTVTDYLADTLIKNNSAEQVNLPKVPERFAALLGGDIEAGIFPEPFSSMAEAKGSTRIASSAEMGIQPVVFIFSETALKNKKQIENFYAAYNEIIQYLKDTPYDDYKDVLVSYKIIKPEMVDSFKLPLDQFGAAKNISQTDVEQVLAWMTEQKMIQGKHSYETLVDQRVVQ